MNLYYEDPSVKDTRCFLEQTYYGSYEELFNYYLNETSIQLGQVVNSHYANPQYLFVEDGSCDNYPTRVAQSTLIVSGFRPLDIVYPATHLESGKLTTSAGGHMRIQDTLYRELEEEVKLALLDDQSVQSRLNVKEMLNEGGRFIPVGIVDQRLNTGINYINLVSLLLLPTVSYIPICIEPNKRFSPVTISDITHKLKGKTNSAVTSYHFYALIDFIRIHGECLI